MGLTWITGVLVFHEALIPVAYIFTIFVAFEVTEVAHTWSWLLLRYHCCISLTSAGCCHIRFVCGGIQAGMVLQSMRDRYIALHMTNYDTHVGEGSIACVCERPSK